jgi:hypothetical protein
LHSVDQVLPRRGDTLPLPFDELEMKEAANRGGTLGPRAALSSMADGHHLTIEECHSKVAECREMARRAHRPEHRVMLEHMAETWERICADLKAQN